MPSPTTPTVNPTGLATVIIVGHEPVVAKAASEDRESGAEVSPRDAAAVVKNAAAAPVVGSGR